MLIQAFGTRHGGVFNAFFDAFIRLCGERCWDEERRVWMPDENEFSTMLALVASHKPEMRRRQPMPSSSLRFTSSR